MPAQLPSIARFSLLEEVSGTKRIVKKVKCHTRQSIQGPIGPSQVGLAEVTPANVADNEQAPTLIEILARGLHFLLGDQHYHDEALLRQCDRQGCILMTSFTGIGNPYPHHGDGVKVRQILHKTRSLAIENFNKHFKAIFDVQGTVPTKGLLATQRFVLSAVFVYQLAVPYCFLYDLDLRAGLKALLKAA